MIRSPSEARWTWKQQIAYSKNKWKLWDTASHNIQWLLSKHDFHLLVCFLSHFKQILMWEPMSQNLRWNVFYNVFHTEVKLGIRKGRVTPFYTYSQSLTTILYTFNLCLNFGITITLTWLDLTVTDAACNQKYPKMKIFQLERIVNWRIHWQNIKSPLQRV